MVQPCSEWRHNRNFHQNGFCRSNICFSVRFSRPLTPTDPDGSLDSSSASLGLINRGRSEWPLSGERCYSLSCCNLPTYIRIAQANVHLPTTPSNGIIDFSPRKSLLASGLATKIRPLSICPRTRTLG